jgi:hypothetical protein
MRTRLEQLTGERDQLTADLNLTKSQLQQITAERDALDATRDDLERRLASLRETSTRAQSLAREIVEACEASRPQSA